MKVQRQGHNPLEHAYPSIARWTQGYGWIEIGEDLPGDSFIRALDAGGQVWEGDATYPTIDAAFRALDTALAEWLRDQRGGRSPG